MISVTFVYSSSSSFASPTSLAFDALDVKQSEPQLVRATDKAIDGTPLEYLISSIYRFDVPIDASVTATNQAFLEAFHKAHYRRLTFGGNTYDVVPDPDSNGEGLEKLYLADGSVLFSYTFHFVQRAVTAIT